MILTYFALFWPPVESFYLMFLHFAFSCLHLLPFATFCLLITSFCLLWPPFASVATFGLFLTSLASVWVLIPSSCSLCLLLTSLTSFWLLLSLLHSFYLPLPILFTACFTLFNLFTSFYYRQECWPLGKIKYCISYCRSFFPIYLYEINRLFMEWNASEKKALVIYVGGRS